jgi:hypothetical protein
VGVARGRGSVEEEKRYESLEGKVKVELVRDVQWSAGEMPGPAAAFDLRVQTEPVIEHLAKRDAAMPLSRARKWDLEPCERIANPRPEARRRSVSP